LVRADFDPWTSNEPYFKVLQASTEIDVAQNMFEAMEKNENDEISFVHFSFFFKDFEVEDFEMVARKFFEVNGLEFNARRYSFTLSDFKRQLHRRSSVQRSFINK
jgi:hypothetical protein